MRPLRLNLPSAARFRAGSTATARPRSRTTPGALSAPGRPTPPPDPEAEPAEPPDEAEGVPPLAVLHAAAGDWSPNPPRRHRPSTPQQRLLILDTWQRSGLPAGDFAPLVGVSKFTPSIAGKQALRGRSDRPALPWISRRGGPHGSKLPELTKRTILDASS